MTDRHKIPDENAAPPKISGLSPLSGAHTERASTFVSGPTASDAPTSVIGPPVPPPGDPKTSAFPPVPPEYRAWSGAPPSTTPPTTPVPPMDKEAAPGDLPPQKPTRGGISTSVMITAIVVSGVVSLAIIVGMVFALRSGGETPTASQSPVAANEQDPQGQQPGQDQQAVDPGSVPDLTTQPKPDNSAPSAAASEGVFSWYGDGLSQIAAEYQPVIATPEQEFYWNADNGKSVDTVISQILNDADSGKLGDMVVFAYGTNEEVSEGQLNRLLSGLGEDYGVILVGTGTTDPGLVPWSGDLNSRFQRAANQAPGRVQYVNWQNQVDSDPGVVERGFMLTEQGTDAWIGQINDAIARFYS